MTALDLPTRDRPTERARSGFALICVGKQIRQIRDPVPSSSSWPTSTIIPPSLCLRCCDRSHVAPPGALVPQVFEEKSAVAGGSRRQAFISFLRHSMPAGNAAGRRGALPLVRPLPPPRPPGMRRPWGAVGRPYHPVEQWAALHGSPLAPHPAPCSLQRACTCIVCTDTPHPCALCADHKACLASQGRLKQCCPA